MTSSPRAVLLSLAALAALLASAPLATAANVSAHILYHELAGGAYHMQVNDGGERLTVNVSDTVTLLLDNVATNQQLHNFTLEGYPDAAHPTLIAPGHTATVTFTASKAGSFAMYCDVPGHRAGGMAALLVVKAAATTPAPGGSNATPGPDAVLALGAFVCIGALLARRR
ncbi:MAG: plastocyanin/azurin family copper-binding protein [Thermoplasmatota archaeon]